MKHFFAAKCPSPRSRAAFVEQLRQQIGGREAVFSDDERFSSSIPTFDRLLPGGGLRYGLLTEWLSSELGSGAGTVSLLCAREACRSGGALVVIDRHQTFYPPAAAAWGIDLTRLIVVHPQNVRDELWAAVQALRSRAVAAVWAPIDRVDARAFRRLQLAAEAGRTLGLLLRPAAAHAQPSWADVRIGVGARGWGMGGGEGRESKSAMENLQFAICDLQSSRIPALRPPPSALRLLEIQILRMRTGRAGGSIILQIDDAAHRVYDVTENFQPSVPGHQPSRLAESR